MNCAYCGKSLKISEFPYWCSKCGAYLCNSCARKKLACPSCGGTISQDITGLSGLIVLFAFAVFFIATAILVTSVNYPHQYDRIGDVHPNEYVSIYGTINSTESIVANISLENGTWMLRDFTSFEIIDPDNSSTAIQIDLSFCRYFFVGKNPPEGVSFYFYSGENVSIDGMVSADQSGNLSVNATEMILGKIPSRDFDSTIFEYGAYTFSTILIIMICVQLHHRSRHRHYKMTHPVMNAPGRFQSQEPPIDKDAWIDNPLFRRNLLLGRILVAFAIIMGPPLFIISVDNFVNGSIVMLAPLCFSLVLMALGPVFYFRAMATAKGIAIGKDGLHIRYTTHKQTDQLKKYIPWTDMKFIYAPSQDNHELMRFELKAGMAIIWASADIQDTIRRALRTWRIGHTYEQSNESGHGTPMASPTSQDLTESNNRAGDVVINHIPRWTSLIGTCLFVGVLIVYSFYLTFFLGDTSNFINASLLSVAFALLGLFFMVSGYHGVEQIVFSKSGIVIKYRHGRREVHHIRWDSINQISPVGFGFLSIGDVTGEKIVLKMTERKIEQRIVEEADSIYLGDHKLSRPDDLKNSHSERFDNSVKMQTKRKMAIWEIPFFIGLILTISGHSLFLIAQDGIPTWALTISLIVGSLLSPVITGISAGFILKEYPYWRIAPKTIFFNKDKIVIEYQGKQHPVGCANVIRWDEIAGVESLPEAIKDLAVIQPIQDSQTRKTIVIRKKSGTAYIFGPVDPAIIDALKGRIPYIYRDAMDLE